MARACQASQDQDSIQTSGRPKASRPMSPSQPQMSHTSRRLAGLGVRRFMWLPK